jgi:hypothetical protein
VCTALVPSRVCGSHSSRTSATPSPAVSTDDKIAKIKELGELKTAGLLTDEEFSAEKAKVLAL